MKDGIVETLHQPEYTGEHRCGPCTVLNVAIAAALGAIVARKSKLAGAITVGVSGVLIYLRGYLVPGTPTLTKRYLPASVLRLFGKEPEPTVQSGFGAIDSRESATADSGHDTSSTATDSHQTETATAADDRQTTAADDQQTTAADDQQAAAADDRQATAPGDADTAEPSTATTAGPATESPQATDEEPEPVAPETYFGELGVLEPCADIDDLCLTEGFETAWFDRIDAIDSEHLDGTDAAASIGLDDDDHEFEIDRNDDARVLRRDDQPIGQWPSQAALVADVTAARALADWDDEWESIAPETKGALLNGLRLFLETCPTTGGSVVMGEETVESCCRSHDVVAVTCEESGERLFEHPVDDIEA